MLEASPKQIDCDMDLYQERELQSGEPSCLQENMEFEQIRDETPRHSIVQQSREEPGKCTF